MPNTSRTRTLWSAVLSFALVAALSACAADESLSDEGADTELTFDTVVPAFPADQEVIHIDPMLSGYGVDDSGANVCDCTTGDCVVNWINDNIGCQVCVSFQCNLGSVHACNPCDESIEPSPVTGVDDRVEK